MNFPRAASATIVWLLAAAPLDAADRNADFTAALRERGWDDTAVDYLNWVEKSPLITDPFRTQLPYQRAISLAAQARQSRDRADRSRLQAQAAQEFQKFAEARLDSPLAIDSLREAANLYAEQALSTLAEAEQLPQQLRAQREKARKTARKSFGQASSAADQIVLLSTKQLAALPKPTAIQADPAAKALRDQLRNKQAEARFLQALLDFENARTHDAKSAPFHEALQRAAARFGKLVEEYRDTMVGTSSRFYQGRCLQEQGEYQKALGCYKDLLGLPAAEPEFRRWTTRAHRHSAECLVALGDADEAIKDVRDWLAASRPAERQQPEWLELTFRLAEAYQMKIKSLEPGDNDAKELQSEVRTLLRDVSQQPNEFQQQARLALTSLGQRDDKPVDVKTFDEAFTAGKTALELMNSSMAAVKIARDNNPDAVEELQQQILDSKSEAQRLLETSLNLADRQTPVEQLNVARYYLCWLYWEEKRLHDAAILGEFLASRYPEGEFAAGAAKVALAALEQLAQEARAEGGDAADAAGASFEARKLAEVAELIATHWPDTPEAASAVNILIQSALRDNRIAEAEELLARLPESTRAAAQLSLGSALWTQYLHMTTGRGNVSTETAAALREKAGALLTSGFASLRQGGRTTPAAASGSLYLVQYLLAHGDAPAALDALQDKQVGPLTLVESDDPVADRAEFAQETYKAALRAYLSTEPPQREQAQAMMTALEEQVAEQGGDAAGDLLTRIYLSLGLQLQRQVKELTDAGQGIKAQQVAAAFGDVLDRIAAQPDSGDWAIRNRIAQINLQIGEGLRGDEAKVYLNRAKSAYEAILESAAKDKNYVPNPNALLGVRMRLGDCQRALGDYAQAVEQYAAILRVKPNMLDLQMAAATALQDWGKNKKDGNALHRAIRGDIPQKDGKNLIWGWVQLAVKADNARRGAASAPETDAAAKQRAVRFEDLFFEARYNVAHSRFIAGTIAPPADRNDQFEAAQQSIDQMRALYPELGGPKWKAAFDELSNQITAELKK